MNNKGFTLIELLATIALLAIVGGIATVGVISAINNSKLKSEKIFVDKISNLIDEYLILNKPTYEVTNSKKEFEKCSRADDCYTVTATQIKKSNEESIYLKDLVDANIIEEDQLVNPKNKEKCFITANPEIVIYKDEDYVYHYYVDLSNNNDCDINYENSLIDNMPENLVQALNKQNLPEILKKKYNIE